MSIQVEARSTHTSVFDAETYKETTRRQWDDAAEAWHRWGPTLSSWLGPATEVMLDMVRALPGDRVLDVAAGAGEQTVRAARRVGRTGRVTATDLSAGILEYAQHAANDAGLDNVTTLAMDGESLEVTPASFDAVISRVAMIYFPDRDRALGSMLRALRPGGRVAAMVYSTAERNGFFSVPVSIIRRRADLPPPAPGQPGPFSLGQAGQLARELRDAGFVDVETRTIEAPLRLPSAADCLRFERESFGALHQMLAGLEPEAREEAWTEVESALTAFETDGGFVGPCEVIVAAGSRPTVVAAAESVPDSVS